MVWALEWQQSLLQQLQEWSPTTLVILDRGMQEQEWLPEALGGSDVDRLQLKKLLFQGSFSNPEQWATMNKQSYLRADK